MITFLENKKVCGFSYLEIDKFEVFTKFIFHVFDSYEIHIQAFVHFINGELIIFNPHIHKHIFKTCTHIFTKKHEEKRNAWHLGHTFCPEKFDF